MTDYTMVFFQLGMGILAFSFLASAAFGLSIILYTIVLMGQWIRKGGIRSYLPSQQETQSDVSATTDYDMWVREQEERRPPRVEM